MDVMTRCVLWIDPVHDLTLAFVSNRHERADPEAFARRLEGVMNVAYACLT